MIDTTASRSDINNRCAMGPHSEERRSSHGRTIIHSIISVIFSIRSRGGKKITTGYFLFVSVLFVIFLSSLLWLQRLRSAADFEQWRLSITRFKMLIQDQEFSLLIRCSAEFVRSLWKWAKRIWRSCLNVKRLGPLETGGEFRVQL